MSQLIVVIGGTGLQGGSVIDNLLQEKEWRIRTISRRPSSEACMALKARGVEVVKGDLNDVDTLIAAFKDANAIFAVTDFWNAFHDPASQTKLAPGQTIAEYAWQVELSQGKNIAKAAATIVDTTLQRFVWSTLSDATKWSKGKFSSMYHFTAKAAIRDFIYKEYVTLARKMSTVHLGCYVTNTLLYIKKSAQEDGSYELLMAAPADAMVPWVDTRKDTGKFVRALLKMEPGKSMLGVSEMMTGQDFIKVWGQVNNVPAQYRQLSLEDLERRLPKEFAREVYESAMYNAEFGWCGGEQVLMPQDLDIRTTTVTESIKSLNWSSVL